MDVKTLPHTFVIPSLIHVSKKAKLIFWYSKYKNSKRNTTYIPLISSSKINIRTQLYQFINYKICFDLTLGFKQKKKKKQDHDCKILFGYLLSQEWPKYKFSLKIYTMLNNR